MSLEQKNYLVACLTSEICRKGICFLCYQGNQHARCENLGCTILDQHFQSMLKFPSCVVQHFFLLRWCDMLMSKLKLIGMTFTHWTDHVKQSFDNCIERPSWRDLLYHPLPTYPLSMELEMPSSGRQVQALDIKNCASFLARKNNPRLTCTEETERWRLIARLLVNAISINKPTGDMKT